MKNHYKGGAFIKRCYTLVPSGLPGCKFSNMKFLTAGSGSAPYHEAITQEVTKMDEATDAQKVYLETLERQTGDHVDDIDKMTEEEASARINALQHERAESDRQLHDPQDIAADTDPDLGEGDVA